MQDYTAMKDVIAACRNAEQGFRGAANAVNSPDLKRIFERYSAERGRFADDLREVAEGLGIHIDDPSGAAGAVHAGWMELKGALTGRNEHQILVETERGEDSSMRTYRQALAMNISEAVRSVLETQFAQVRQAHDRIRALRDSTEISAEGRRRHA